jgi:SAM-dependent methyltransferase
MVGIEETSAATVFNSMILSYIVLFFNREALFPHFAAGITAGQLSHKARLEPKRLQVVLDASVAMGMLALEDSEYRLTALGKDLAKNRGFFTWAIGGYAPLLEAMGTFMTEPATPSLPYVRSQDVAIGSDECNQGLMEPIFRHVIDALPVSRVADLGCGNAGRLVSLLERRPDLTGVGIDIAPQAIEVAKLKRAEHNLQPRLQLVQEDVFQALGTPRPEFQDVELVMSFMMLHDLFNITDLKENLFPRLKAAFPAAKYFVFADTCLDGQERTFATMPIFAMGFELVHALRGIDVFPLEYYQQQFAGSGLKLAGQYKFGAPNTYIFVLEV